MTKYLNFLNNLCLKSEYHKNELLTEDLLMNSCDDVRVYWAPFDFINSKAKVVIIGITPGWTQMVNAISFYKHNQDINDIDILLKKTKNCASFSGSIRRNLVTMLDEIGLNAKLKISSCDELFQRNEELAHFTSVIRYPTFVNGDNYSGKNPSMLRNEVFIDLIHEYFVKELKEISNDAIIIPLGKKVMDVLVYLKSNNLLNHKNILIDFPHPSGQNGHRVKIFNENREQYIKMISNCNV